MEKELTPEELKRQKSRANRAARKAKKKAEGNSNKEIEIEDEVEDKVEEVLEKENIEEILIENFKEINEEPKKIVIETLDKETIETLQGSVQINKELSPMAKKWKAYIEYNKLNLHTFLDKYPRHKFRNFIEEIIEFEKKNNL